MESSSRNHIYFSYFSHAHVTKQLVPVWRDEKKKKKTTTTQPRVSSWPGVQLPVFLLLLGRRRLRPRGQGPEEERGSILLLGRPPAPPDGQAETGSCLFLFSPLPPTQTIPPNPADFSVSWIILDFCGCRTITTRTTSSSSSSSSASTTTAAPIDVCHPRPLLPNPMFFFCFFLAFLPFPSS